MLYSVYSLPNLVMPFAGGMLVDRMGVNFSLNLFCFLILIGQVLALVSSMVRSIGAQL